MNSHTKLAFTKYGEERGRHQHRLDTDSKLHQPVSGLTCHFIFNHHDEPVRIRRACLYYNLDAMRLESKILTEMDYLRRLLHSILAPSDLHIQSPSNESRNENVDNDENVTPETLDELVEEVDDRR